MTGKSSLILNKLGSFVYPMSMADPSTSLLVPFLDKEDYQSVPLAGLSPAHPTPLLQKVVVAINNVG